MTHTAHWILRIGAAACFIGHGASGASPRKRGSRSSPSSALPATGPACLRLYRRLEKIRSRYPNDVAIVYRNYPLDELHPSARPAAIAAQCAARHGKFPDYYRHLFENQQTLESANWSLIARPTGVTDTASFTRCLRRGAALYVARP